MHVQECPVTRSFNNGSSSHVRRDLYVLATPTFPHTGPDVAEEMHRDQRRTPAACLSQCRSSVPDHSVTAVWLLFSHSHLQI